jgi:hypothetical protein
VPWFQLLDLRVTHEVRSFTRRDGAATKTDVRKRPTLASSSGPGRVFSTKVNGNQGHDRALELKSSPGRTGRRRADYHEQP